MMTFPTPTLLIFGPLPAVLLTALLSRRKRVSALAGVLTTAVLIWRVTAVTLDSSTVPENTRFVADTWLVFGRTLTLTAGIQAFYLFFCFGLVVLFLLALAWPQGRGFVPASLLTLSPLAAALMIAPFEFGAVLLVIAAACFVLTYRPHALTRTYGALRYLLLMVLAMAILLVVGWLLNSGIAAGLSNWAVQGLIVVTLIVLAGFPIYIWVQPIVAEASLLVLPFLFGLLQTAILVFLFNIFQAHPQILQTETFSRWMQIGGIGTVLVAALLATTAARWRDLLAYLLLLNMGMGVLALALPGAVMWETAVLLHVSRFLSLLMAAGSLSLLTEQGLPSKINASKTVGWQFPLSTILFVIGLFSLIGFPLSIGFPAQWLLLAASNATAAVWLPLLLLIGLGGGVYGVLLAIKQLWASPKTAPTQQPHRLQWALGLTLVFILLLGIFPRPIIHYAAQLASAFLH